MFNFTVNGQQFNMAEATILSMKDDKNPQVQQIYIAGMECIKEYREAEQEWKETRREEQAEVDFALEHDMMDDVSEHYF